MKKWVSIIAVACVCGLGAACRKNVPPGPDVWALVDGKEITRAEVEKYYPSRVNPQSPRPSHEEELTIKLNILDELITNEILQERANKLNLIATDAEVEDKFTEAKSHYSEEEFQQMLRGSNLTVEDLKANLRRQIAIEKLLNREVVSKISFTDDDVKNYYLQHIGQFNVPETQYHIAEIGITPRPDPSVHNRKNDKATSEASARSKATLLEQKLHAGADFGQLAMDYSEDPNASSGGDLGFGPQTELEHLDPAIKHAVLALRPGEVSPPVLVRDGGLHILKLIEEIPAGQRQFPDVQQSIRDTLRRSRQQLVHLAFLAEVRGEAHVTNYLAQQILESSGKLPSTDEAAPSATPYATPAPAPSS